MFQSTKTIAWSTQKVGSIDIIIFTAIFAVPLIFSGPQLVVGTVVNACLFLAAANWSIKKLIPLAILPSLGAILHGVVLGTFTPFLFYLTPFIWLGNLTLMLSYQLIKDKSVGLAVGLASMIKALLLFGVAWLLVDLRVLPEAFLMIMGVFQLATAIFGGVLASLVNSLSLGKT